MMDEKEMEGARKLTNKSLQSDSIENRSLPSLPSQGLEFPENSAVQLSEVKKVIKELYEKDNPLRLSTNIGDSFYGIGRKASFLQIKNFAYDNSTYQSDETAYPEEIDGRESGSKANFYCATENKSSESFNSFQETRRRRVIKKIILPNLSPSEEVFFKLVAADDVNELKKFLNENKVNVNCINYQGVSALQIAIQNRNETMVKSLLEVPNIEVGDAVLHAVRANNIKILIMLLDANKRTSPGLEFAGTTHSTQYPEHVTPLILAAQLGHYEIISVLMSRGHVIPQPHGVRCFCSDCQSSLSNDDSLYTSSYRLSYYRAIASPAYLVHITSDPILAAFRLSVELEENSMANRQLAAAYLALRDDVNGFAVELIGCCRTSDEVEILLKQTSGSRGHRHFVLPRLLMAVNYKQKEFVAHPNTQQVLESHWLGDWHSWKNKDYVSKLFVVFLRVFITPFILILSILAPCHRLVKHWQIPINKLITHATAYVVFLGIVFFISNQDKTKQKRGPPNTGAEPYLVLYVCGYFWSAFRMCLMQGPRKFFSELWNWGEVIMLILFGITFVFWTQAAVDCAKNKNMIDIERKYWKAYDPTLLAEGTYCLATIFAFFRLMFLCQLNYHLGPLQVSLGKMTIDIYKYMIVFSIIICAFTAGLARLYQYYDGMVYEDEFGVKTVQVSSFTSLSDTLNTLFWALFCMAPLESADVIVENTRDSRSDVINENHHTYTERIGYFCFGFFEVISVIVVLNMLIATMSNTFQKVNDNVAIEWTFGRTEVYVNYMLQTTLPSPYNLIPTASGMTTAIEWIRNKCSPTQGVRAKWSFGYCFYIERDVEAQIGKDYPALMSVLVQRYFRKKSLASPKTISIESQLDALKREVMNIKAKLNKK